MCTAALSSTWAHARAAGRSRCGKTPMKFWMPHSRKNTESFPSRFSRSFDPVQFLAAAQQQQATFDADRVLVDLDEIAAERMPMLGVVELTRPLARRARTHATEHFQAHQRAIALRCIRIVLVGPSSAGRRIERRLDACDDGTEVWTAGLDADHPTILVEPEADRVGERGRSPESRQHEGRAGAFPPHAPPPLTS